ncbi:MAG: hypothetical protein WD250_13785 [Egibacteraceae bacterium]
MKIVTLRDELVPADGCVVIRGGAGTLEHDHVRGQAVENHDRYGFYGVSVFVTPPSAVADLFGDHPIGSRYDAKPVFVARAATLLGAGFPLLPTGLPPHYDVVLPDVSERHLVRLRNCFDGPVIAPPEPLPPVR